jgi:hypothetical protein
MNKIFLELIGISIAGIMGALSIPELFNAHNTNAAMAGGFLLIVWFCWTVSFIYRMSKHV